MKYKSGMIKEHEEKLEWQEHQEELKEKHNIEDDNVVVVEKDDKIKFFIRLLISFMKIIFTIVFIILAAIGVFCLIYPNTRDQFFINIVEIEMQLMDFLPL